MKVESGGAPKAPSAVGVRDGRGSRASPAEGVGCVAAGKPESSGATAAAGSDAAGDMSARPGRPGCGCMAAAGGCGFDAGAAVAGAAVRGGCDGARLVARPADLSGRGTRMRCCPFTGRLDAAASNSIAATAMTRFFNLLHTVRERILNLA